MSSVYLVYEGAGQRMVSADTVTEAVKFAIAKGAQLQLVYQVADDNANLFEVDVTGLSGAPHGGELQASR